MEHAVERLDGRAGVWDAARVPLPPAGDEAGEVGTTTLGAGAVARGERRRFVEEEEVRVLPRLHQLSAPSTELELTGNPGARRPAAGGERAGGVVQTAAIAGERA